MTKRTVVAGAIALAMVVAGCAAPTGQQASSYRAPRTSDGNPDLQGLWQVLNTADYNIQTHEARQGVPAGLGVVVDEEIPYLPAALAQKQTNFEAGATADPAAQCFFPGTPRIMYMPYPFRIVQTTDFVELFFEFGHHTRIIYTNGVPHHEEIPIWMGDSRGRWDGETFVVDTKNFYDENWFDKAGNYHSEALELVERFTRTGPDHIRYEVTVTDATVFTRPWTMSMTLYRRVEPNARLLEYECFALDVYEGGRFDEHVRQP